MRHGRGPLQSAAKIQLLQLEGFQFQDFIVSLNFKRHGAAGFLDLRRTGDGGCDGAILDEGCVIACYAPDKPDKAKLKAKIREDHGKYLANWKSIYPRWRFYMNHDPAPDDIQLAKGLGAHVQEPWGVERVLEEISQLHWGSQIVLYKILGVDPQLIGKDYILSILDDLMHGDAPKEIVSARNVAPSITKKIELNISEPHQDAFEKMLLLTDMSQPDINEILSAFDNKELEKVKSRFNREYQNVSYHEENFIRRFELLQQRFNDRYNQGADDDLAHNIDALLGYMFCQCLIGKDPGKGEG